MTQECAKLPAKHLRAQPAKGQKDREGGKIDQRDRLRRPDVSTC